MAGVAIATVISNVLSAGMVLTHLARRNDDFAFRFRRMRIEKTPLLRILQIGIPAGIQGAIFSISNVFIQSGINSFGENAIAGSSLALNFEYFTYDIANAFAQDVYKRQFPVSTFSARLPLCGSICSRSRSVPISTRP